MLGLPAGGGVEEIEIGGDGNDSDLEEVEDAEPIDAGGVLVGARKEHHEDGSGPDEEQNIGGPGNLRGTGDKALVVGADGLSKGFESEGDGEKKPELARVGGRAARDIEGAGGSEEDHHEVEGIGNEEAFCGAANGFEIEEKQDGYKNSERNGKPRKLAGREQGDLTYNEGNRPSEARVGKSLHQSGAGGGRVLSFQLVVLSKEKRESVGGVEAEWERRRGT